MDPLQEDFERGVGDRFADWLTSSTGQPCSFLRRADQAPDLVYSFNGRELFIEVTAAYYDRDHARFLWTGARDSANAPAGWVGTEPDKSLAAAISNRILDKCGKRYGTNVVLLIAVPPGVTSEERLQRLLNGQAIPAECPFVGVYVAGRFPITTESAGGYGVIALKPLPQ